MPLSLSPSVVVSPTVVLIKKGPTSLSYQTIHAKVVGYRREVTQRLETFELHLYEHFETDDYLPENVINLGRLGLNN